jgi:mRNA interferase MazF
MNRGDIYWCDFEPATGAEIRKLRPAIIISNDISNKYIDVVQVIPLTSNTTNIYPSECLINTSLKLAKALCSQLTTLDKSRIKGFISKISQKEIRQLESAIMLQLGIKN